MKEPPRVVDIWPEDTTMLLLGPMHGRIVDGFKNGRSLKAFYYGDDGEYRIASYEWVAFWGERYGDIRQDFAWHLVDKTELKDGMTLDKINAIPSRWDKTSRNGPRFSVHYPESME